MKPRARPGRRGGEQLAGAGPAPPPFPLLAGLAMAVTGWRKMARDYDAQDCVAAVQAREAAAATLAACVALPPSREVAMVNRQAQN